MKSLNSEANYHVYIVFTEPYVVNLNIIFKYPACNRPTSIHSIFNKQEIPLDGAKISKLMHSVYIWRMKKGRIAQVLLLQKNKKELLTYGLLVKSSR